MRVHDLNLDASIVTTMKWTYTVLQEYYILFLCEYSWRERSSLLHRIVLTMAKYSNTFNDLEGHEFHFTTSLTIVIICPKTKNKYLSII